ncbi:hypothetical protein GALMADRAFT_244983 [Galerina marginata CBS 339.88]|uniref:DUF8191 domain-containing protein n=1 Tax=Galerina marginata (strain CBS 339.88) TaxID=685588 RepID=A0A067T6R1_GALM3|nr:hypothetical protein GALMADRAFT_244983 [Galerina marginata CBS 339.88]
MSVSELKTRIRIQNIKLRRADAENKGLREALRVLLAQNAADSSGEGELTGTSQNDNNSDEEMGFDEDEDDDDEDRENLPEPILGLDELYTCTQCTYEVVDGVCFWCWKAHRWLVDETAQETVSTDTQAIHPDRSLVPRGNTPLREIGIQREIPASYRPSHYPVRRESREDEYLELLKRGATRFMCEVFSLEFTYLGGIYAWADDDLFREFSGPLMQPGDLWKIHLGRRIALDEGDEDGSEFIEGLLEDVLLYPYRSAFSKKKYEKWETVEESPGIWVTRLQDSKGANDDDNDSLTDESCDEDEWAALCAQENKDLVNSPAEETATLPNKYSTSDDDTDQDELEMEDLGFFNSDCRDAAWDSETDSQVDQLDNPYDKVPGQDVEMKQEPETETEDDCSDSDEAGSDFDSDEDLSGDE